MKMKRTPTDYSTTVIISERNIFSVPIRDIKHYAFDAVKQTLHSMRFLDTLETLNE